MKLSALLLVLSSPLLLAQTVDPQPVYPKDFRSPLDIPLQLAGNFGELRSNHFHAGLDCRTQQREGLNVYAVGDGYISRIKISPYGYGKAIYIDHPGGYTTVYGHLREGSAKVEAYIRQKQYEQKSFEVDVFPKAGELPVTKGEMIAYSGNTGGSEGPHLHFEFRDTKSEKIINPMLFGFDQIILDHKKPIITSLLAYPVSDQARINGSASVQIIQLRPSPDGSYTSDPVKANGKISFGFSGYDQQDYGSGKNGIYKVQTWDNGTPSFGYTFNSFAFDETRYINALIDYYRYKKSGTRIQQTFLEKPLDFDLFRTDDRLGQLDIQPNTSHAYRMDFSDFHGNTVTVNIPVEYAPETTETVPTARSGYLIRTEKDAALEKGNFSVFIPAHTFYEDRYMELVTEGNTIRFGDDTIPAHSSFTVSITDESYPENLRDKVFIAGVNGKGLSYNGTKRKGNVYTCYSRQPGQFRLALDTVRPRISLPKAIEGKWITKDKSLLVNISDNLSGLKTYNGYLNGNWILFEFDYKKRLLRHDFDWDSLVVEGRNELKIEVSDNAGNSAIFETHFFRSLSP